MLEAIKNDTPVQKGSEGIAAGTPTVQKPKAADQLKSREEEIISVKTESESRSGTEVNDKLLADLEHDLELIHNVGLQFSLHEATGRTMVTVKNRDTDKIIREIPPKSVLDLAAKLDEMIGILFDETI